MSEIYLLKNQDQAYLDKSNLWINSGERKQLFRTPHKDEALNMRVEWAVKHPELRIEITKAPLDEKGLPEIDLPRSPKVSATAPLPFDDESQLDEERPEEAPILADTENTDLEQAAAFSTNPQPAVTDSPLDAEQSSAAAAVADSEMTTLQDESDRLSLQRELIKSSSDSEETQEHELSHV